MGLFVASYFSRDEILDNVSGIQWSQDGSKAEWDEGHWEGRAWAIHEGHGENYGSETAVFHATNSGLDTEEDVPKFDFGEVAGKSSTWKVQHKGRKLFRVMGEVWKEEWIPPADASPRVKGDDVPPTAFFAVDSSGTRESRQTLGSKGQWLWFRPELVPALLQYRDSQLHWYTKDSIPPFIESPNEKTEGIKHILNSLAGTPYIRLSGAEDPRPYQERLGFRDLMALVFQSQEVVANQNILFYKTHAHEHRERLKNWLPYILGAETPEVLIARQRLSTVQVKLAQLRREHQKATAVSNSWLENMSGHLQVAKRYGLLPGTYEFPAKPLPEELIGTARDILATKPETTVPTPQHLDQAAQEMLRLEKEEDKLSDQISHARKRLDDIVRLKSGLTGYGDTARRRADRLQISQWLEDIATEARTRHIVR
ncbi:hypothetical protein [Cupriavidus agavae]|uniref:hypothetical protein n=1 Tax=Cupriavidus agavae TaxID=1001822 RepID=UPI00102C970D|nr:hypothetical protein [Cupriavidus agavae]